MTFFAPGDPGGTGRPGEPVSAGGPGPAEGADRSTRLPALTRAEGEFVDHYLAVVDLLGRLNPARGGERSTYGHLRSAQALVAEATALRDALTAMFTRDERELFPATLTAAMRALDGERRAARVTLT